MFDPTTLECPDCGAWLSKDGSCRMCGFTSAVPPSAPRRDPMLEAVAERERRRREFRGCDHVPVGQREACPTCEAEMVELRARFREHLQKINARSVRL